MAQTSEPYVGPRPFEEQDGQLFFGRDQEANELVSLITAHPIVLLYAQSGAGKTSLVKASVIGLLANQERFSVLPPMRVREQIGTCASAEKVRNIYMFNALVSATHAGSAKSATADWTNLAGLSLTDFLKAQTRTDIDPETAKPTVLIFDQFEEFFTFYPERWEERQRFFEQIREALAADSLLRVLFSMREDFIAELDPYAFCLPEKLRIRYRVERLNRRKALSAITQPLSAISSANDGRSFAPGAAEELVDNLLMIDVKTPQGTKRVKGKFVEALQLQVVCQALWNSLAPSDKVITKDQLLTFGDVDRALTAFYEKAIEKTNQNTGVRTGALRRWCESALITPAGTRAPVFRDEKRTQGLRNEAVDELERQSLLRMEMRGGAQWYELTHDRFVEVIRQANQQWLLTLPGAKQSLLELEKRAEVWNEKSRPAAGLLSEEELFETNRWLKSPEASEFELGANLAAFLGESQTAIDAKRKAEEEERRRIEDRARTANLFRKLTYALAIVTILTIAASVFAGVEWRRANQLRVEAEKKSKEVLEARGRLEHMAGALDVSEQGKAALSRSAKALSALNKLNNGDLPGAEKEYREIIDDEKVKDPLERANAHFGLGEVEFKRRPQSTSIFKKAIQYYDEALNVLGYDPKGKMQNENPQPDLAPAFRDKAAFYLREKGELYQVWGEWLEEQKKPRAAVMYNNALGFYWNAKGFGGSGVNEATEGFVKAKKSLEALKPKPQESPK